MKNKANFGSRSIGAGFGSPPPGGGSSQSGSFGDPLCYTAIDSFEIVLHRNQTVGLIGNEPSCNWEVAYNHNVVVTGAALTTGNAQDGPANVTEPCNDNNCGFSVVPGQNTFTITDLDGDAFEPAIDMCDLDKVAENKDLLIKWKKVRTATGCADKIDAWLQDNELGSRGMTSAALAIRADFPCWSQVPGPNTPNDYEDEAEEIFRKILACLCKISKESDPAKKEEMEDNLERNLEKCAEKFNKRLGRKEMIELLNSLQPGDWKGPYSGRAITEPGIPPFNIGGYKSGKPASSYDDETLSDFMSLYYQQCLAQIKDFCAKPKK